MHDNGGQREYRLRLSLAAAIASLFHAMLLAVLAWLSLRQPEPLLGAAHHEEPVILRLQQPDPPKRLVDTVTPTEAPVDPDTDLISDQPSQAADMGDVDSGIQAPAVDRVAEFDDIGGAPEAPAPPPAPPTPQPTPEAPPSEAPASQQPQRREVARREPDTLLPDMDEMTGAPAPPQAMPIPAPPTETPASERPGESRGRVDGGVHAKGFVGFEAFRSELAPYMLEVRQKVEAQWKGALQLRYTGTAATEAVLLCAIAPDGTLARVDIVEPGASPTYASLCKLAIEKAAPFGPFPFEVPEMYRSRHLEIRWTFSYLSPM